MTFDGFNLGVGTIELNTFSLMMFNVDHESMSTSSLSLLTVTRCVGRPFRFESLKTSISALSSEGRCVCFLSFLGMVSC